MAIKFGPVTVEQDCDWTTISRRGAVWVCSTCRAVRWVKTGKPPADCAVAAVMS